MHDNTTLGHHHLSQRGIDGPVDAVLWYFRQHLLTDLMDLPQVIYNIYYNMSVFMSNAITYYLALHDQVSMLSTVLI